MVNRLTRWLADGVHNCVAHPVMFLSGNARWAVWFHDWTARIAYDPV